MNIITKAQLFATEAHNATGETRKYSGDPYIVHPEAVATYITQFTTDESLIAAAWLHDILEDTAITKEELAQQFGDHIAHIVDELTLVSREEEPNTKKRTEKKLLQISQSSPEAQLIKLADIYDNTRDLVGNEEPRAFEMLWNRLLQVQGMRKALKPLRRSVKNHIVKEIVKLRNGIHNT